MKFSGRIRYGDATKPVEMTLLKAVLALLLAPVSILIQLIIVAFVIILNMVQCGMYHITFKVEARDIRMPDGQIRKAAKTS